MRASEFRLDTHRAMTGTQQAKALDEKADGAFAAGVSAGQTSDSYVRATMFLASVLFLVGISSHFPRPGCTVRAHRAERRGAPRHPRAARPAASTALLTRVFTPKVEGRVSTWPRSGPGIIKRSRRPCLYGPCGRGRSFAGPIHAQKSRSEALTAVPPAENAGSVRLPSPFET